MPRWREFLDRFRPVAAPGAAAPRGVPADRTAELTAELSPVLARLDKVQDDIERMREATARQAETIRETGRREAAAIVERARLEAGRVSDQAMTQQLSSTPGGANSTPDAADEVRTRAQEHMPAYVRQAVDSARTLITRLCDPVEP